MAQTFNSLRIFDLVSAMNNIYDQLIFPVIFALKTCAVHYSKAHVKSEHGIWPQVNINTRFEKNYYFQIKYNVQSYKANLMPSKKNGKSFLFYFKKELSRRSFGTIFLATNAINKRFMAFPSIIHISWFESENQHHFIEIIIALNINISIECCCYTRICKHIFILLYCACSISLHDVFLGRWYKK